MISNEERQKVAARLRDFAKEIEESDVDGTIDWADRIREIVR